MMPIKKPLKPVGMRFWLRFAYWHFLFAYYIVYGPVFWWRNKRAKGDSSIGQIFYELSRIHTQDDADYDPEMTDSEIVENEAGGDVVALIEAPKEDKKDG